MKAEHGAPMADTSQWYEDDVGLLGELRRGSLDDIHPPTIQGYEDLREIRRGGQGIVYTAQQRSTRRRVAIKLIREGGIASRSGRLRFEREIDLVASLRHPNIVRIYDSGFTGDGRPYFVMEYIEGQALDEFARAALTKGGGRGAKLKDLLRLLKRVAEAVSHAHEHGVIHRDLKPSNIRVDAAGEPHVLDFGLAKLVGDDADDETHSIEVSITGQFMGSLPWASPEQAEGASDRIDIRTDVYALGVILYQLLTGTFPYDVVGPLRDVLNNIISEEPSRPSSTQHHIDDEIETIILKCLAKEPERRYQSARALADDIERYLTGQPIEAKRDSTWYTLRKTVRRYRMTLAVTSILLVLSLAFAIAMTALYRRASLAEATAANQLEQTIAARDRAEVERVRAEQTLNFLTGMLESVNPVQAQGRDVTILKEMLDDTARRVENRLADQPAVRATLHLTLGRTYNAIGRFADAEPHLRAALEINRELYGENDTRTLVAMNDLGILWLNQGEIDDARRLLETAYAKIDVVGRESHDGVSIIGNLATLRTEEARYDDARELHDLALETARGQFGDDDQQTFIALNNVAGLEMRLGNYPAAEAKFRELLAARRRLLGDDHPDTILSISNLAALLKQLNRFAEARPLYEETLERSIRVHGESHQATALAQCNLGALLHTIGELEVAECLTRAALETQRRILGPDHRQALNTAGNLAYLLSDLNRKEEAEPLYYEVLAGFERTFGPDHPETVVAINNLAQLLQTQGKSAEAEPLFKRALDIRLRVLGEEHSHTLLSMSNLASFYQGQERWDECEALNRRTLEIRRRVLGDENLDTAISANNLANFLLGRERYEEAEPLCKEAVDIACNALPAGHWIIGGLGGNYGTCLLKLERYDDAEPVLLEAFETMRDAAGIEDPRTQGILNRVVELYDAADRPADATAYRALQTAKDDQAAADAS